jgi:hypothetical protein
VLTLSDLKFIYVSASHKIQYASIAKKKLLMTDREIITCHFEKYFGTYKKGQPETYGGPGQENNWAPIRKIFFNNFRHRIRPTNIFKGMC